MQWPSQMMTFEDKNNNNQHLVWRSWSGISIKIIASEFLEGHQYWGNADAILAGKNILRILVSQKSHFKIMKASLFSGRKRRQALAFLAEGRTSNFAGGSGGVGESRCYFLWFTGFSRKNIRNDHNVPQENFPPFCISVDSLHSPLFYSWEGFFSEIGERHSPCYPF